MNEVEYSFYAGPCMTANKVGAARFSLLQGILPIRRQQTLKDALAGFQLAAMNIPQAMGYTKIAGTPVVTGLYALLLPIVAFAVFGSSRYLVVSADSATAAILAGGLREMAPLGSARYVELASLVALLTSGMLLLARFLRLGFLADFLSQTVLVGFLTGVGFQVGIAVMGEMLGVQVQSRRSVGQLLEVVGRFREVHPLTAIISIAVIAIVFGFRSLSPKVPASFIAVIAAIAASAHWNLAARGVANVGPVAGGLPHFSLPPCTWREALELSSVAASCFVMIVAQSAATARFYAARHQQALDENADLVGLSAANAAAAVTGTFVVNGSPTQTAMVEISGGQSQLAQVSTAAVVAVVLLFLSKPLQFLPTCILGAIVFVIAIRLVDLRALAAIRRESPREYALALFTAAIVILIGVEQGIVIAMVISLLRIVRHSYQPQTALIVIANDGSWEMRPVATHALIRPGVAIYRFGAALFYANAPRLAGELRELIGSGSKIRWLIVDAEAIPNIDYTAAHVVREIHQEFVQRGIKLALSRVAPSLRSDLARHRILDLVGAQGIFSRLHDALAAASDAPEVEK